ncbi:T9SS type A sorting domain-containing protein, partial [Larkinella harenae]
AQVHHNQVRHAGVSPFANFQNNGVQIGGGSGGSFYNNTIRYAAGNGLIVVGHAGDVLIANNVVADSRENGIFVDEREKTLPNTTVNIVNNTIANTTQDGIRLYNETQFNTVINNAIAKVNGTRYLTYLNSTIRAVVQNNYTLTNVSNGKFINPSGGDYRLDVGSPLIDKGKDVRALGVEDDITGQPRPRGVAYDIGAFEQGASMLKARSGAEGVETVSDEAVKIQAYPSPVQDELVVVLSNKEPLTEVSLVDLSGHVHTQYMTAHSERETRINVKSLAPGIYILSVTSGTHLYTRRFVKK